MITEDDMGAFFLEMNQIREEALESIRTRVKVFCGVDEVELSLDQQADTYRLDLSLVVVGREKFVHCVRQLTGVPLKVDDLSSLPDTGVADAAAESETDDPDRVQPTASRQ